MFFRCVRTELWKAFHNKGFFFAWLTGFAVQMCNVVYNIFYAKWSEEASAEGANVARGISLYLRWISADGYTFGYTLLVLLFPILAIMPYGWSFLSECRSGYRNQILCRQKKLSWFVAKYLAVFISGGSVIFITLLENLFLNALILPATKLVCYDMLTSVFAGDLFSSVYYTKPLIFVLIYMGLDFLYGGLIAATCMLTSQVFRRNIYVMLLPFFVFLLLNFTPWFNPMQLLLIGGNMLHTEGRVAILVLILFLVPILPGLFLNYKKEIL